MIRHLQERASSPGSSFASCTDKAESISIYRCKTYYTTFLRNVPMPVEMGMAKKLIVMERDGNVELYRSMYL